MPMKPELKKAWIEALRSGKYEQGTYNLKHNGKYCCLGVLCEIAGKRTDYREDTWEGGSIYTSLETLGLPLEEDRKDLGLSYKTVINLSGMNDCGATFQYIAYFLEQNPEI